METALACAPAATAPARAERSGERAADPRCARIQLELRQRWRDVIRQEPPERRERFLDSPEGIVALGAQTCHALLKALRRQRHALQARAAGAAVVDAWDRGGAMLPGFEFDDKGRLQQGCSPERGRPGAVRLRLSRAGVRNGLEHPPGVVGGEPIAGVPTRRWTPPQAVDVEDLLDGMDGREAAFYDHPISCSAAIIIRIGEAKAKPKGGKW
jgi:hypothetical protein